MKSVYLCSPSLSLSLSHSQIHMDNGVREEKEEGAEEEEEQQQFWFHSVKPCSSSSVSFPHQRETHTIIDFPVYLQCQICRHLSYSNLSSITIFPFLSSFTPSLSLSLFVLLINFITLIAPHCLLRKQLPSLPPLSAQLSSPPSLLFPSLVAESSN